ncbi:hypothetical protein D3C73_1248170 [compost metagenome]
MVPALHKGAGKLPFLMRDRDVAAGERILRQLTEEGHVQDGQFNPQFIRDFFGAFDFQRMALTVIEGDGFDFTELLKRPKQAGGTVLAAAENNDRFFIFKHKKTSHSSWIDPKASKRLLGRKRVLELTPQKNKPMLLRQGHH